MIDPTGLRIGLGRDVHRLQVGRPLKVAGCLLPGVMGPDAHSDGDVVLHALCDALTGAAGLDDIGQLFPDTDPTYRGADSRQLLSQVLDRLRQTGCTVLSADVVVELEHVKLAPHKREMRRGLAELLGVAADRVNIKGKTAERMGPIGEGRAIEATAVVLIAARPGDQTPS